MESISLNVQSIIWLIDCDFDTFDLRFEKASISSFLTSFKGFKFLLSTSKITGYFSLWKVIWFSSTCRKLDTAILKGSGTRDYFGNPVNESKIDLKRLKLSLILWDFHILSQVFIRETGAVKIRLVTSIAYIWTRLI